MTDGTHQDRRHEELDGRETKLGSRTEGEKTGGTHNEIGHRRTGPVQATIEEEGEAHGTYRG